MATYSASGSSTSGPETHSLVLSEQHIYGSSRLGILSRNVDMKTAYIPSLTVDFTRGLKSYELSNHLGNVLVTISDKKVGHDDGSGNYDYFEADVVTANDYYPFGMMMPGRKYISNDSYRYGFNGKENDNEVKGEGNQQDYGMRVYDPRLGKFLSVDPMERNFSFYSPYQFAGNMPILAIDLDGMEPIQATIKEIEYKKKDNSVVITAEITIKVQIINMSSMANKDLDLISIQNSVRQNFATQFYGKHSAPLPSSHKLDFKSDHPEVVPIYNQQYTFNITNVNVQVEIVNSTDKLTSDAIVVGIVDDLAPRKGDNGQKVDPIGLTNNANGIALLEANEVKLGKMNFERGQSLLNHELGHTFNLGHVGSSNDVMHDEITNTTKFTNGEIVEMLRNSLGNWAYLWDKKKRGQDFKLNFKRDDSKQYGSTGEQTKKFAETQEK